MYDKLTKIIAAYEELETKLGDPAVLADQKEYTRLAKEHARQGELATAAREYISLSDQLASAKEELKNESDPELKELAQEEISDIEGKLPQLEEDIKFMLLPADPNDEKDIIVEIRGGAGGDEANIFAGDLFRMYERFAESKKWKVEVIDASPSDMGGFKEISFKMLGDRVYSSMKFESGVHRVQRSRSISSPRICVSTCIVPVAPAASASTRPTPPCASRIFPRGSSCSRRIRSRRSRTARRRCRSCAHVSMTRCSRSSRRPSVPSVAARSATATVPRRSAPTMVRRTE